MFDERGVSTIRLTDDLSIKVVDYSNCDEFLIELITWRFCLIDAVCCEKAKGC